MNSYSKKDPLFYAYALSNVTLCKGHCLVTDNDSTAITRKGNVSSILSNTGNSTIAFIENFNGTTLTRLKFVHWGQALSNVHISNLTNNSVINTLRINGTTGNDSAGFTSFLHYAGRYVSIMLGNVNKKSFNPSIAGQISFNFVIKASRGLYWLTLVNGPLSKHGWIGNNYYNGINSYSTQLIDLEHLIASHEDKYLSLEKIFIVLQRNLLVSPLDFKIDFFDTAIPY